MIKRLHHACITTSDIDRSLAFYRDTLGLKLEWKDDVSGGDHDTIFGESNLHSRTAYFEGGLELTQFFHPEGRKSLNLKTWDVGVSFFIFEVTDLENMYPSLKEKGVNFVHPPITLRHPDSDVGGIKIAHLHGPDGERISLLEFLNA